MCRRAGLHFTGTSNRLEKWADKNLMKFNNRKCKVLQPGRNNFIRQHSLGADRLEGSFAEKDLRVLMDDKLTMSQHVVLWQRWPTACWAALGRASPASKGKLFFSSTKQW